MFIIASGAVIMRKFLVVTGLIFGLLFSAGNFVFANDTIEKTQTIAEIGTLSNQGNYNDALLRCKEAMKKYPNEADLYYWSASIKTNLGDNKSALEDFNKAIKLNPKDGNAYVMRGIVKAELGDNQGAISDFNKAIELNPKDSSAYSMRACTKIDMGDIDGANKDLELANKFFDEEWK